ncbi:MAG: dTDP-glucose 4,6-dehydratase [Candidatus Omnitrophica bacterium]|nr:dTDP-glucose 4,6-dehydratase [Candidatus Omnitrophota bacterium]
MCEGIYKVLVSGGAGFMGSEFVRQGLREGYKIVVVDRLTYAGDLEKLKGLSGRFRFYKSDICDQKEMIRIFLTEKPQAVINFAAETHVDRSIYNPAIFIETNLRGTQILLDISRRYKIKKFIQVSTDEVYGEIRRGSFCEESSLKPSNPYAASKAAADLLVMAYVRTYGFPAIIVRPCNNYGPWQEPEKLVPLAISYALKNASVPIYGTGENIREWLYVSDCIKAVLLVLKKGGLGEIYNIGSGQRMSNLEVVRIILDILGKDKKLINYVKDRPGHDFRYSLDCSKIRKQLGWQAKVRFTDGLKRTVIWYIKHQGWLTKHLCKNPPIPTP